jgi:hypothetical protein
MSVRPSACFGMDNRKKKSYKTLYECYAVTNRPDSYILGAFAWSRKASFTIIMSVRLSACTSAVPIGWIEVKFDIGDFHENLSRKTKFG